MQVRDVMTQDVRWIAPTNTLQEAAQKMKKFDVGPLPVCENKRLKGILTDRDIVLRAVAEGLDPKEAPVSAAMTADILYCYDDQELTEAAQLMTDAQVRRLVVLNRDKHLVGIVTLGDVAVESRDDELVGRTLEAVSQPV